MDSFQIFIETGKKRTFAGAVHWPGWCRSGRDENTALQTLLDYWPRYAQVLQGRAIEFQPPTQITDLVVIERHAGNVSTDYGAPAMLLEADREALDHGEFEHLRAILQACWRVFDAAVERAAGVELEKGPRGGGRDLDKLIAHVIEADRAYLSRLAWKYRLAGEYDQIEELSRSRQAVIAALEVAVYQGLPEQGPRGGIIWPARYFIRRVAWHVLDHAWEIEDRIG